MPEQVPPAEQIRIYCQLAGRHIVSPRAQLVFNTFSVQRAEKQPNTDNNHSSVGIISGGPTAQIFSD